MKHFYADSAIPPATLSGQPSGRTVVQGADEEEETDTQILQRLLPHPPSFAPSLFTISSDAAASFCGLFFVRIFSAARRYFLVQREKR